MRSNRSNDYVNLPDGTTSVKLSENHSCLLDTEDWNRLKHWLWSAGGSGAHKYACTKYGPRTRVVSLRMHREVMLPGDGLKVDHINHDTLDNRKSNLRLCTHKQNIRNMRRKPRSQTSFKGAYLRKLNNTWQAKIYVDGKSKHLGYYQTDTEAAIAYDNAAKKYFGEFAHLNFAR